MDNQVFKDHFKELTGDWPLLWQIRLYENWFAQGRFPSLIDLPTGMGKTMVMAIWLIARKNRPDKIPTRLIYVVDRRTVVDQATDLAVRLQCKFGSDKLPISTLRGQLADNRQWSTDPSQPSIVIGTVDLIGSALLFSGYRSGYKRRPLEAGLLGQDSLLLLDEAHLSRPFEELICAINDQGPFQNDRENKPCGKPMRVIRMSATTDGADIKRFTLEDSDLSDKIIEERFTAKKRLTIEPGVDSKRLKDGMTAAAIELAKNQALRGKRLVIFVRKPDDARSIADLIRRHGAIKGTRGTYAQSVEVLTGTMRGLERDKLVEKPVLKRFLDGHEDPDLDENRRPVFLVSTSAGEVGFDLNADHLVGDTAPLDSWIQRLGRVNRRGKGEATVILVKDKAPPDKTDFDKACITASELELFTDGKDVSPKALGTFKQGLTSQQIRQASSPKPATVDPTDVLLDAWSMTSIIKPMPGRPPVGPWLRGTDEEQAQTTVAWRAELDLFREDPTPEKVLAAVFVKHPIRPHESLTVNTGYLLEFFKRISKLNDRPPDLVSTRVAVRLARGHIECRTLHELIKNPGILYADSTLILPATFGGLDNSGMLDAEAIPATRADGDPEPSSRDVADRSGYEQTDQVRSRLRVLIERLDDRTWTAKPLPGLSIPEDIRLEPSYDKATTLFNDLKDANLRVRLVQSVTINDEGEAVQLLVILAPAPIKKLKEDQLLTDHVGAVEAEARRIADALHLAMDDPIRIAFLFAARWHDEGKKADIWQFFAYNPQPDEPLGKMAKSRDPRSLRGYRHEFGSLLRIQHPERCSTTGCYLPIASDARDLALHLIATHHGAGRPHFSDALYDPFTNAERDGIHTETIRRFARLQRKYGWWYLAWLENLLRCADQLASADEEVTEIDEMDAVEQ